jgi:hypothetical protein
MRPRGGLTFFVGDVNPSDTLRRAGKGGAYKTGAGMTDSCYAGRLRPPPHHGVYPHHVKRHFSEYIENIDNGGVLVTLKTFRRLCNV